MSTEDYFNHINSIIEEDVNETIKILLHSWESKDEPPTKEEDNI